MGGFVSLFSPPSPPSPPPAPLPPPAPDSATEEERRRRMEALARRRRTGAETVATSLRGLLRLADGAPTRKSLLGE